MRRILLSCLLCLVLGLPGLVMSEGDDDNKAEVSLYGRLWPKVTYTSPSDGDASTDITDAISRLGVAANYKLSETLTAVALAEVRINLNRDGDGRKPDEGEYFLTENLGYVGLQSSDYGLFAIGTQWNPYYNIVAEVTDVYYHSSSPFGYDERGPFRVEKLVRYALSFSDLKLDLGIQVSGQDEGAEDFDKVYAGVGYSYGPVYVGLGYLGQEMETDRRDYIGLGASLNVTDDLYVAATYQSIQHDVASDEYSLDVVASYDFDMGYTLTGGFFEYDADTETSDPAHRGYNLTLIKALNNNVKVFAEWLRKDFEEGGPGDETEDAFSLGIRVDFNAKLL